MIEFGGRLGVSVPPKEAWPAWLQEAEGHCEKTKALAIKLATTRACSKEKSHKVSFRGRAASIVPTFASARHLAEKVVHDVEAGATGCCAGDTNKIGVPGGTEVNYKDVAGLFSHWNGSVFQTIHRSQMFYLHLVFVAIVYSIAHCDFVQEYDEDRLMSLPEMPMSAMQWSSIFLVAFMSSTVYGRFNSRFHDICKCNGALTVVNALSAAYLPHPEAYAVTRYGNSCLCMYYLLLDGAIDQDEWLCLLHDGRLTAAEIAFLQGKPSAGTIVFSWAAMTLKRSMKAGYIDTMERAEILANLATTRGMAAKQIAYQLTAIPKPWFDSFTLLVHVWLMMLTWGTALQSAEEPSTFTACLLGNLVVGLVFETSTRDVR
jgi:hypothetical protein